MGGRVSGVRLFDKHPQDDRIISFFFARIPCLYILLHAWKAKRNNREPFVKTKDNWIWEGYYRTLGDAILVRRAERSSPTNW
jgi:hypothetical protein